MDNHWNTYKKAYKCSKCLNDWFVIVIGDATSNLCGCPTCQTLSRPVTVSGSLTKKLFFFLVFLVKSFLLFLDYSNQTLIQQTLQKAAFPLHFASDQQVLTSGWIYQNKRGSKIYTKMLSRYYPKGSTDPNADEFNRFYCLLVK